MISAQTIALCVPPADEVIPKASRIACCFGSARVALRTCTVRPSARLNVAVTRWRPPSIRLRVVQLARLVGLDLDLVVLADAAALPCIGSEHICTLIPNCLPSRGGSCDSRSPTRRYATRCSS